MACCTRASPASSYSPGSATDPPTCTNREALSLCTGSACPDSPSEVSAFSTVKAESGATTEARPTPPASKTQIATAVMPITTGRRTPPICSLARTESAYRTKSIRAPFLDFGKHSSAILQNPCRKKQSWSHKPCRISKKQSETRVFQAPRNVVGSSRASRSSVKKHFLVSRANGKRIRMTDRLSQIGSSRYAPLIKFDDCTNCRVLLAYCRTREKAAQKARPSRLHLMLRLKMRRRPMAIYAGNVIPCAVFSSCSRGTCSRAAPRRRRARTPIARQEAQTLLQARPRAAHAFRGCAA